MEDDPDKVAKIYSTISLLRYTSASNIAVTPGDLVRLVHGQSAHLGPDQTRYLFSQPSLLQLYRELKRPATLANMPLVAAASSNDIDERQIDGGTLQIFRQAADIAIVFVKVDDPTEWVSVTLQLENASFGIRNLHFRQSPEEDGEMQEFLDLSTENGKAIYEALVDPLTIGTFLKSEL